MDMENKKLELKIPEKVSDHQYVIQGIGKHEMTILVIQFLAAIGLPGDGCRCFPKSTVSISAACEALQPDLSVESIMLIPFAAAPFFRI